MTVTIHAIEPSPISIEVFESPLEQSTDAQIIYKLDTTKLGGDSDTPPSSPAVVVYNTTSGVDVSATVLSGSPSVTGSDEFVTLPTLKSLVKGYEYRVEIKFTIDGSIYEQHLRVIAV